MKIILNIIGYVVAIGSIYIVYFTDTLSSYMVNLEDQKLSETYSYKQNNKSENFNYSYFSDKITSFMNDKKETKYSCNCSKTCTKIKTCSEAKYQLEVCGCEKRDRDNDGIACDKMCQN